MGLAAGLLVDSAALAAPARATQAAADVRITMQPDACDVAMQLDLDLPAPGSIEHRLALAEGLIVDGLTVTGAGTAGEPRPVGRTLALPIAFAGSGRQSYALRYRAALPGGRLHRCPLFLPLTPTDGLSRSVMLQVTVPPGASRLPGDFPAFVWDAEGRGRAALGHLPAFVLVRTHAPGEPLGWLERFDTRRVVDLSAIAILIGASAIWAAAQRRRRIA